MINRWDCLLLESHLRRLFVDASPLLGDIVIKLENINGPNLKAKGSELETIKLSERKNWNDFTPIVSFFRSRVVAVYFQFQVYVYFIP